eukprot:scaffold318555_cov15-Prasinocladus_malaysianus.AAC.1
MHESGDHDDVGRFKGEAMAICKPVKGAYPICKRHRRFRMLEKKRKNHTLEKAEQSEMLHMEQLETLNIEDYLRGHLQAYLC